MSSPATDPVPVAVTWSRRLVVATVVLSCGPLVGLPAIPATIALIVAGIGFVAGVPHGAADHVMATRSAGGRSVAAVAAAYGALATAAWALLQWAGPIALCVVVALSAVHFGLGELEVARQLTGWRPARLTAAAIVIAGSGALVLPLARSGAELTAVARAVSPALAPMVSAAPVQIVVAVTWLLAALLAVTASLRSGHPAVAVDTVLIGALGMLAPPLVAFAVWFGGWHALRHCARMLTIEPGCTAALAAARPRAAALRLIRLGAWPSIAALTVVAALGWFTVAAPDPTVAVAGVLRLLLALTVPHMMVVAWLDSRAGRPVGDKAPVSGPGDHRARGRSPRVPARFPAGVTAPGR